MPLKGGISMKYDDFDLEEERNNESDVQSQFNNEPNREEEYTSELHRKRIEVDEVLGVGREETNFEVCIPLIPPAFEILEDLIKKTVEFDTLVASQNKVFINARLIKNIPFKTKVKTVAPICKKISKITFGDIRHVTVEIPFTMCINVPGSIRGAKVVVLNTSIDSVEIPNFISERCKIIKSITEKVCIKVKVKVVKDRTICVPAKDCEIC
jgi:hypothetical protein